MSKQITTRTHELCGIYNRAIDAGEEKAAVIGHLAELYDVQRPAIHKALRSGGVLPPYSPKQDGGQGRPIGGGVSGYSEVRRAKSLTKSEAFEQRRQMPRVDRDPCPCCGVRRDIGCKHSGARLGMMFS